MDWTSRGAALTFASFLLLASNLLVATEVLASDFPQFDAETLSGKKLTMPGAVSGKCSLLIIGFSQASSGQTAEWTKEWAKRSRSSPDPHSCSLWSVAVLEDAPRLLRSLIVRGIKSGVPKDQQDSFLTVFKGEAELKAAAGFQQPDDAYLILLDPKGAVIYRSHGAFSDSAMAELRKQIR